MITFFVIAGVTFVGLVSATILCSFNDRGRSQQQIAEDDNEQADYISQWNETNK